MFYLQDFSGLNVFIPDEVTLESTYLSVSGALFLKETREIVFKKCLSSQKH